MRSCSTPPVTDRRTRGFVHHCGDCGQEIRGLVMRCPRCGGPALPLRVSIRVVFWITVILLPLVVYELRR